MQVSKNRFYTQFREARTLMINSVIGWITSSNMSFQEKRQINKSLRKIIYLMSELEEEWKNQGADLITKKDKTDE